MGKKWITSLLVKDAFMEHCSKTDFRPGLKLSINDSTVSRVLVVK